jgi:hypothetical protein
MSTGMGRSRILKKKDPAENAAGNKKNKYHCISAEQAVPSIARNQDYRVGS